jgi:hypothetical protein
VFDGVWLVSLALGPFFFFCMSLKLKRIRTGKQVRVERGGIGFEGVWERESKERVLYM